MIIIDDGAGIPGLEHD